MTINELRVHPLRTGTPGPGPVIYWMSREQRVQDNWGLLYARQLAGQDRPLIAVFCLAPTFLGATLRQYDFMLSGLETVEQALADHSIPFFLEQGDPATVIPRCVADYKAGCVVTDFDPLRIKQHWQQAVAARLNVPLFEVDGHNVIPARIVSDKQEYAARTIRPKIHRLSHEFLEDFPTLTPLKHRPITSDPVDWAHVRASLDLDTTVGPAMLTPGGQAAHDALADFVDHRLDGYAQDRNDPNAEATSRLSGYFHFGQLAPQRAALAVAASNKGDDQAAYLEELIVRRELSDNFCLHNQHYDSLRGAAPWALKTLDAQRDAPRSHEYPYETFEAAQTHSALWNAAQSQLITTGFMHGYMRMFWAKKILEWTASPEEAHSIALRLNDRFQLDGGDPNGYVGVLWSVAGLHDRGWKNRPVFGSIRYMNENGCRRKFDVDRYCRTWLPA
ncbi:deoxyribodipyrimidine photo-lyase [Pseudodesulfovibrio sp. JC047]|uniref:deoxyribodipyrimidine photo-lyase n=1 Tax=Pseudodesulfovibrio sp. JC047 TaxID=2683199 RepID=UPI0013D81D09|nr:deoxyribodipyrimidine photo-lyase [Pseudodesulfovibrio sp. JC047]NDV18198.1 deoxyribodipyrimidine photo-lyase [Pseudodesulfovibrio sp. JC047]